MHVGMVRLGGEKMSKSLGNLVFVHTLLETATTRRPIRLALLAQHYRGVLGLGRRACSTTPRTASSAGGRRARARRGLDAVRARLDDDLDTPGALAAIDEEAAPARSARPPTAGVPKPAASDRRRPAVDALQRAR